jgi:hypothetical protein
MTCRWLQCCVEGLSIQTPIAYPFPLETTTSCDFYGGLVVQLENHEHAGEEVAEAFDQSHADNWEE